MKKKLLLIASLLIGVGVNAQFTESNSPVIGATETLYLLDSNAVDYATNTGGSAVWDYSATTGYVGETRLVDVKDPTTTANADSFPTSQKALELQGLLMSYLTTDATRQKCQGFHMNDATAGDIVARFTSDEQDLYQYPLALNGTFTDNYSGVFSLNNSMIGVVHGPVVGDVTVTVDGQGELKLAGNTYSNVLRYKLVDNFVLSMTVPIFGAITITVNRVQYEYYDFTHGNLPIFVHSNIVVTPSVLLPATNNTVVLSLEDPNTVGLASNDMEQTIIYPNPTSNELNIQLPSSIESANVSINDALGRQVYASEINSSINTINVSQLNRGVYFVKINDESHSITKRVVIK